MKIILLILALIAKCQSLTVGNNMNADAVEILKWGGITCKRSDLIKEEKRSSEDRFIHYLGDGYNSACYYHKNCAHRIKVVACENGLFCSTKSKTTVAQSGMWACASIPKAYTDNTYYYKCI